MAQFTETVEKLVSIVGKEHVKTEPDDLATHAVDNLKPKAVVFPKDTQQVSKVVELASRENRAIVPRGSGSKMSMGNPPKRLDLVVCTSRMNHMIDVDTSNLTITVEAGVKFRDIQARLATEEDRCYLPLGDLTSQADEAICSDRSHSGCFLPIDPPFSDIAAIGGIIATNSTGPRRLLYNLPRDMILGVRLVAPSGLIAGAGGKTVKNVSGYDTSKLMAGSLGSLGIMCEMTFRLLPLPEKMATLLLSFESFSDASKVAKQIFDTTLLPAAVEVMNGATFTAMNIKDAPGFEPGEYVVVVAFEAFQEAVDRMRSEIKKMGLDLGAKSDASLDDASHQRFWLAVSELEGMLARKFSGLVCAKLNYRISEWEDVYNFCQKVLSDSKIDYSLQAHAGSGICLLRLLIAESDGETTEAAARALEKMLQKSVEAGGNLVIQRAPASAKGKLRMWGELSPDFIVMRRLKEQLDTSGIMSPGRFVGGL